MAVCQPVRFESDPVARPYHLFEKRAKDLQCRCDLRRIVRTARLNDCLHKYWSADGYRSRASASGCQQRGLVCKGIANVRAAEFGDNLVATIQDVVEDGCKRGDVL